MPAIRHTVVKHVPTIGAKRWLLVLAMVGVLGCLGWLDVPTIKTWVVEKQRVIQVEIAWYRKHILLRHPPR